MHRIYCAACASQSGMGRHVALLTHPRISLHAPTACRCREGQAAVRVGAPEGSLGCWSSHMWGSVRGRLSFSGARRSGCDSFWSNVHYNSTRRKVQRYMYFSLASGAGGARCPLPGCTVSGRSHAARARLFQVRSVGEAWTLRGESAQHARPSNGRRCRRQ